MKLVFCAPTFYVVQYVVCAELRYKYAHFTAMRRSRCDYVARTNDGDATESRRAKYTRGLREKKD